MERKLVESFSIKFFKEQYIEILVTVIENELKPLHVHIEYVSQLPTKF